MITISLLGLDDIRVNRDCNGLDFRFVVSISIYYLYFYSHPYQI